MRAILHEPRQFVKLRLEKRLLNIGPELVAGRNAFPETRQLQLTLHFIEELLRERDQRGNRLLVQSGIAKHLLLEHAEYRHLLLAMQSVGGLLAGVDDTVPKL